MQQDSPGKKPNPPRNERYRTPSQPKLLSMSSAKKKAKEFAAKDNKKARVGAKKAILQELNTHLSVRAQALQLKAQEKLGKKPYGERKTELIKAEKVPAHKKVHSRGRDKKPKSEEYTWNKDGNQQETRIHFLARKYFSLWTRNVYGRVHPLQARDHYNLYMKRHALRVWQDIWWSGRKGWKLNIRAEYHNRYRMWQNVFKAWRMFMMLSQAKKTKDKLAVQYANGSLLLRCLKGWRKYIEIRRYKRHRQDKADEHAVLLVKRRVWHRWRHQMTIKYEYTAMEQRALQFWAINLIGKAWSCWLSALYTCKEENSKLLFAAEFSNRKLLLKVWRALKNYRTVRKLKAIQKRVADRQYAVNLARKMFRVWVTRWQRQIQLSQFDDLITYRGAVARTRRAFTHWKFYVMLQHNKHDKEKQAGIHYRKHLLQTSLNCLHLQAIERRLKEMRKRMAEDAWNKLQLRRIWMVWLMRCEHSEELKLYSLTRRARTRYRSKLLYKALYGWILYCRWRRHRRAQYSMADMYFQRNALPRYFARVKIFVELMQEKRENVLAAEKFRREVLYAQTFYKWHTAHQLTLDLRLMDRMAILHHDDVIKRRYVRYWAQQARERLRQQRLQAIADTHNDKRLLADALRNWKHFTGSLRSSRSSHHTAVRHYYFGLLRCTWSAWIQFVRLRQVKWRKQATSDVHYQHRVTRKALCAWKCHHARFLQAQSTAAELFKKHMGARLREMFSSWREYAVELKNKRIAHHLARKAWKHTLTVKVFRAWCEYAALHALQTEEKFIRVQEMRVKLDEGKRRRAFHAWKAFSKRSAVERSLIDTSARHYRRTLLCNALGAWSNFTRLQFRIQILHRQSMWLHNQRITSYFFMKWRQQYATSLEIRRKSTLALWHWSVTLQRDAFYAWLKYAISRKRKEVRIAHALDQRRTRLLRTGISQWLKVAFHLASERNRYAQARQLEATKDMYQCVYRCAIHWRRWAAKRGRERDPRRRPDQPQYVPKDRPKHRPPAAVGDPTTRPTSEHQQDIVAQMMPDLYRARAKPRVPDYLRESYDISNIAMETEKSPIPANLRRVQDIDNEEALPRPSPPPLPSPRPRLTFHPRRRPPGEESIVFPPSSEGEGESFIVQVRRPEVSIPQQPFTHSHIRNIPLPKPVGGMAKPSSRRGPLLLPPSSFEPRRSSQGKGGIMKTSPAKSNNHKLTSKGESDVRISGSTLPASTPRGSPGSSHGRSGTSPDLSSCSDHSDISGSESGSADDRTRAVPRLLSDAKLQTEILSARNKLQEYHDLKVKYRNLKRQRDELEEAIHYQRENTSDDQQGLEELRNAEELLVELTDESRVLCEKIDQDRPHVERLAVTINELITRTGINQS